MILVDWWPAVADAAGDLSAAGGPPQRLRPAPERPLADLLRLLAGSAPPPQEETLLVVDDLVARDTGSVERPDPAGPLLSGLRACMELVEACRALAVPRLLWAVCDPCAPPGAVVEPAGSPAQAWEEIEAQAADPIALYRYALARNLSVHERLGLDSAVLPIGAAAASAPDVAAQEISQALVAWLERLRTGGRATVQQTPG